MPKSYSQYKYKDVEALGITLRETAFLTNCVAIVPSAFLEELLRRNTKRFLSTEKAKSEFIIAPILYEIAYHNQNEVSFFSGHNLEVDKDLGLKGFCDFLFSKVPESPVVKTPIFCIVEAKNDNLDNGIPQCIAEMYAAQLLNKKQHKNIETVYGCVTTGYQWLFLKLDNQTVLQDTTIYPLTALPQILGVLQYIINQY